MQGRYSWLNIAEASSLIKRKFLQQFNKMELPRLIMSYFMSILQNPDRDLETVKIEQYH